LFAHTDTSGLWFLGSIGPARLVAGFLVVAALVATVWFARRESPSLSRLALVAIVLLGAALVDGANVPRSIEAWRVNLYHWAWAAVFLTWTVLGIALGLVVRRFAPRRAPSWIGPVALLAASALVATSIAVVRGADDRDAEPVASAVETRVAHVVLDRLDHHQPVAVVPRGVGATLAVAPYVLFRMVQAGFPVEVTDAQTQYYGTNRRYRPGTPALVIVSGTGTLPKLPGLLLLHEYYSRERSELLDALSRVVARGPVELAPNATALVHRRYHGLTARVIEATLPTIRTEPRAVLAQPEVDQLVLDGILRSPALDVSKVRRLLALPPDLTTAGGDEQVAVYLLSPADVRAARIGGLDEADIDSAREAR
jgi:hypothetical protein